MTTTAAAADRTERKGKLRLWRAATLLPAGAAEAWSWHARPGALQRLSPPWLPVEAEGDPSGLEPGTRVTLHLGRKPLRLRWVAEHRERTEGRSFRDVQTEGPFASWDHLHRLQPHGRGKCWLEDNIEYALPLGRLGALADGAVRRSLERVFAYRHRTVKDDLEAHAPCRRGQPFRAAVTGSTGLLGSALGPYLVTGGHEVTRVVRGEPAPGDVAWDPRAGRIDAAGLEGLHAVFHLAGENIAGGPWTEERKGRIRDSRVLSTRLLAETLAGLRRPPRVLVCASAVGFYGDRGETVLDESHGRGEGFLSEVCEQWEAAAGPAARAGVRVVHARLGVVLTPAGGMLARMLPAFRLGLGGPLGSGRQYVSWIGIDDVLDALHHLALHPGLDGPVNVVAPHPVTQAEMARTLGSALSRPARLRLPAAAVRLALGALGRELVLASTRAVPDALLASGFSFRHPRLEDALDHLLGRNRLAEEDGAAMPSAYEGGRA